LYYSEAGKCKRAGAGRATPLSSATKSDTEVARSVTFLSMAPSPRKVFPILIGGFAALPCPRSLAR